MTMKPGLQLNLTIDEFDPEATRDRARADTVP